MNPLNIAVYIVAGLFFSAFLFVVIQVYEFLTGGTSLIWYLVARLFTFSAL